MGKIDHVLAVLALVLGLGTVCWAQEAASQGVAAAAPATSAVEPAKVAGLRAEIHRTLAALIEARSATPPDRETVTQLSAKLEQLRAELAGATQAGTRLGRGAGNRPGYGAAMGAGQGPRGGRGAQGRGAARGYGQMPAWGPGAGIGPGAGLGAGAGLGPGRGPGFGRGPGAGQGRGRGFIDLNRNGICDRFEMTQPLSQ